jgi:hypothetical protein
MFGFGKNKTQEAGTLEVPAQVTAETAPTLDEANTPEQDAYIAAKTAEATSPETAMAEDANVYEQLTPENLAAENGPVPQAVGSVATQEATKEQ